ncbi:MAG: hypothetical protein LUG89_04505 [Methanosphaera sp.]|nr:hypothetical protein [Methanosphaera sp.]
MLFKIDSNLLITTSRKPSQKTRQLAQFIKHFFSITYVNRGKTSFNKIITKAQQDNYNYLLVITETKGNPSSIKIYDINTNMDDAICEIYCNASLPKEKVHVNIDSDITIINKSSELSKFNEYFDEFKPDEKIKSSCVVIKDYTENNNIGMVNFIDKNENILNVKLYIKGYNITYKE